MCLHHPSVGRGTGKNTAPSTITEDVGGCALAPLPRPLPKKTKILSSESLTLGFLH